jgi:hypothetical protein
MVLCSKWREAFAMASSIGRGKWRRKSTLAAVSHPARGLATAERLKAVGVAFPGPTTKRASDMYRFTFVLAANFLLAVPASHAADQATCADQFKAADLNNDGVLSASEIGNAKDKLPAAVVGKNTVNRIDFMAACTNPI